MGRAMWLRVLLFHVINAYTWLSSGEEFLRTRDASVLRRPHKIQIAVLGRLLQLDLDKGNLTPIVRALAKMADEKSAKKRDSPLTMFNGHVIEIPTGQGKSITLGIFACILALLGRHVDVVCYSQQLTDRDAAAMRPLITFCAVEDRVSYLTFHGVMERRAHGSA
jgi:hypothetical protein